MKNSTGYEPLQSFTDVSGFVPYPSFTSQTYAYSIPPESSFGIQRPQFSMPPVLYGQPIYTTPTSGESGMSTTVTQLTYQTGSLSVVPSAPHVSQVPQGPVPARPAPNQLQVPAAPLYIEHNRLQQVLVPDHMARQRRVCMVISLVTFGMMLLSTMVWYYAVGL